MREIWRAVKGLESSYEVSSLGSVRSIPRIATRYKLGVKQNFTVRGRVLKTHINRKGYVVLMLGSGDDRIHKSVHRLVAEVFVTGEAPGLQVNHRNGIKTNNYHRNLEWVTNKQNTIHSFKFLGRKAAFGESNGKSKLTEASVSKILSAMAAGAQSKDVAIKYGVTRMTVDLIRRGKIWKSVARK